MHAWMCVCECKCMCSCFDQQLKFWTCNRLSVVKFPLFLFNFFFVVVFMPASAPSSLPLSDSFLLHVFIKLFLNFVYPFFPTSFLMRFYPPLCLRALLLSVFTLILIWLSLCLCFLTMNLCDLVDWSYFIGIPLSLKPGIAFASCRRFVFISGPQWLNCSSKVKQHR